MRGFKVPAKTQFGHIRLKFSEQIYTHKTDTQISTIIHLKSLSQRSMAILTSQKRFKSVSDTDKPYHVPFLGNEGECGEDKTERWWRMGVRAWCSTL